MLETMIVGNIIFALVLFILVLCMSHQFKKWEIYMKDREIEHLRYTVEKLDARLAGPKMGMCLKQNK